MKVFGSLLQRWRSFTKQEKIVLPLVHLVLFIFAVWMLLPMFFVLLNSVKPVREYDVSVLAFPKAFEIGNYAKAFKLTYRSTTVLGMFFNSAVFTVTFCFATMMSSCMAAYVISKYKFRGRGVIYSFAIVIQILPIFGTMGSGYMLVSQLGLLDNIWLLWITGCFGFNYTFLVVHSYFENVSWNYAEAAFIDGAGNFRVFIQIMMPMVWPAVLTMGLATVISLWNDYITPLLMLPSNPTLSTGIYNLKSRAAYMEGGQTAYFAAIVLSCIPVLLIFVFTQRKIFGFSAQGGIKG